MTSDNFIAGPALLEVLPVAIYLTDPEGHITFYNEAAADLWGHRPALGSKWCGSWKLFQTDGRRVRFQPTPNLLTDGDGRVVGGINLLIEVTDRRETDIQLARLAAIVS